MNELLDNTKYDAQGMGMGMDLYGDDQDDEKLDQMANGFKESENKDESEDLDKLPTLLLRGVQLKLRSQLCKQFASVLVDEL